MKKTKAGVVLLSAEWFIKVGIQSNDNGKGKSGGLSRLLKQDSIQVIELLSQYFDVVNPGLIITRRSAEHAIATFKSGSISLLIVVFMMWSEDGPLVDIAREFRGLPLILWCYNPYSRLPERMSAFELFYSSGAVGFLQATSPIRKLGLRTYSLCGSPRDADVRRQIAEYGKAFSLVEALAKLRVGQIAPRCEPMTGTYVDEFAMRNVLGATLVPITAYECKIAAEGISEARANEFYNYLTSRYEIRGVSEKSLRQACIVSLGIEEIVITNRLGAVAIEDLNEELHRLLKTRPPLWTDWLIKEKITAAMEGDVTSAIGMWCLRQVSEAPVMYTEIFTYDLTRNVFLMGHAAPHDPALAGDNPISIVPDYEYEASDPIEGAWLRFRLKPGPVEVAGLYYDGGTYRFFTFKGEVLDEEKLTGCANGLVKVDFPVRDFFAKAAELGMTQHFTVSFGDTLGVLKKAADILGIEYANM